MKIKKASMTFQQAIKQTPDVAIGFQTGLGALRKYTPKVHPTDQTLLNGSVDIDNCTKKKYPNANRWDYALSYNESLYFVEIHSANTSQVSVVLKKLEWLKTWLNNDAPLINQLKKAQPAYYWISSNNFNILRTSPQYRRIVQAKLIPKNQLHLK